MKLSARNVLPGIVKSIKKGPISSSIALEIAPGLILTSVITTEAVKELKLKKGSKAHAIIKSSGIMLGVD